MVTPSPSSSEIYLAAIEGGGTTFVVSVARVLPPSKDDEAPTSSSASSSSSEILRIGPQTLEILQTATIPPKHSTTGEILHLTPHQILEETCTFLRSHVPSSGQYSAVGIATFGPAGVDPQSREDYGTILSGSPKKEWRNVDLLSPIAEACGLSSDLDRVGFDTDVNAPALAEFRHRSYQLAQSQTKNPSTPSSSSSSSQSSKPLTSLSYVTIGTGVGVGLIINSQPIHGLLHPEGGHVAVRPLEGDTFTGYSWGAEKSPYGGVGTVEGVTSSVALTERYLQMQNEKEGDDDDDAALKSDAQTREVLATLPDTHDVWSHAANAIANLCVSLLLLTSCQKIVLGGGIMKRTVLYDAVRKRTWELLNGYLDSVDELSAVEKLDDVIVEGSWESMGSGLVGAFALALDAHENATGDDNEDFVEENETLQDRAVMEEKRTDDIEQQQQQSFTSGVLAGIGLSFRCMLISSLFGHGRRRQGR